MWVYNGTSWKDIDSNSTVYKDIIAAYGSMDSLTARLSISMNDDGTLKSTVTANVDEFKTSSYSVTYVNSTTFTVNIDVSSIFTENRKIKATLGSATPTYVYSSVASSSYNGTITTIVLNDAVLNLTLTDVRYSIIQYGLPVNIAAKTAESSTKATQDGNGNVISTTYLPLGGGTMTGYITTDSEIRIKNSTINSGFFAAAGDTGIYDWTNSRYAFEYLPSNTINVGNSSSTINLLGTVINTSGNIVSTGEIQIKCSSINSGPFSNATETGIFDWFNGRYALDYIPASNIIKLGNSSSTNTISGTTTATLSSSSTLGGYTAASLISSAQKTSASLGTPGWWKDSNTGILIQWAKVSVASGSTGTISWPTTFPNSCFFAWVSVNSSNPGSQNSAVYSWSTTGASLYNGASATADVYIGAIGY